MLSSKTKIGNSENNVLGERLLETSKLSGNKFFGETQLDTLGEGGPVKLQDREKWHVLRG